VLVQGAPEPAAVGGSGAGRPGAAGLRRQLSSFGVLLLTLSSLSPVFSVYGVGGDVLQHAGTGAVALFLLGLGAALVWALVYAELGSAYPYAGGDYVGVGRILGGWAGVATLTIWTATTGPSCAFQSQILATYVQALAPGISLAAVTYGSVALAVVIALLAVRTSALVTGLFLLVEMIAVLSLIIAGLSHPLPDLAAALARPKALTPAGVMAPVSLAVLALASVSAVYGTVGGNQALYFGEELIDPHRRMGRVIVIACLIGASATALPIIAVALGAPDLKAVLKSPAPFATFMTERAGPLAARALSAGVALAIFNANIAGIMWGARLLYSLGRDELFTRGLNRLLTRVHERSGAPRIATLAVGAFGLLSCLLSAHLLLIFVSGLLVYGWSLVCLAVLVGRLRGLTGQAGFWRSPLFPLAPALGLAMAVAFTLADLLDPDAGRPSLIVLGVIFLAGVAWYRFGLQARPGGWTPSVARADAQDDHPPPFPI
jgi:amino acid transporter